MLGDPKRSKTQRKKIAEVHRLLVEIGVLEAPGAEGAGAAEGIGAELPLSEMGDDVQPGATVPSTRAAGASEDLTKALFKKLAEASHPDKATDESDRARRTEAMKRLTVAYRTGDLAALVELDTGRDEPLGGGSPDSARKVAIVVATDARGRVRRSCGSRRSARKCQCIVTPRRT
ncbi:MAG: J domain-containing protein [Polyangiaceae bacterium]